MNVGFDSDADAEWEADQIPLMENTLKRHLEEELEDVEENIDGMEFTLIDDFKETTELNGANGKNSKNSKTKMVLPSIKKMELIENLGWSSLNLHETLLKNLLSKFNCPTPIQSNTLVHSLEYRRDIIGSAPTGSGKTLAFGIPILNAFYESQSEFLGLVMAPTRELAHQIRTALMEMEPDLRIVTLTGGLSMVKQARLLTKHPHLIIATPGRLWDFMSTDAVFTESLCTVRFLVIDEADRMVESGHFKELSQILSRISVSRQGATKKIKRQTMVFSATLIDDSILRRKPTKKKQPSMFTNLLSLVEFSDKEPLYFNLSKKLIATGIHEAKIECLKNEKDLVLYYLLLRYPGKTIVFVNSIDSIRRLAPILVLLNIQAIPLHAEMKQKQRLASLEKFKESVHGVLIASDVAARGLDVPQVSQVIHFQVPRTSDLYVHRSGRTARGLGNEGVSILLIAPEEISVYKKMVHGLKREDEMPSFPMDRSILSKVRDRLDVARKLESLQHKSSKSSKDETWMKQAALDADIYLSDQDSESDTVIQKKKVGKAQDRDMAELKSKLKHLLGLPLIPKGISGKYLTGNVQQNLASVLISSLENGDVVMPSLPTLTSNDALRQQLLKQNQKKVKTEA